MKCRYFKIGGIPQLRTDRVQDGMAQLVVGDIWTFARIDGPAARRPMKERQTCAIIIGVEVFTLVQLDSEFGANGSVPLRTRRQNACPEVNTTSAGGGCGPVAELCRTGRIDLGRRLFA